ncbi:VPS15 [[Candida] subhashii]|uniref:non-specific serine/threonine protein kinase n=1 Tax=[Candida] subhashii TaxID=561895 RepID=A0A8J5R668_9ASCO|nr:VPS15 [[Candida] subhashii]KAG7665620.1 VPS15 [[Candida] subhashii]
MGARLSLLAPSAPTVAVSSYVDALNNYHYLELINNSRFLKTIKAIDKTNGNLVIIKLLIKPSVTTTSNYNIQLQEIIELLVKQSSILYPFKNTLPWHKLIETDRAGYLIRQMIKTNLYDRLSLRPFLEPIEKLFIVFQIIKLISELHSLDIHHGDLRLENILVTSWNWILLSDFANLIKPTYIPEDNPSQFSFYFDSSARRVCYIAPERFYNSQDHPTYVSNFNDDGSFKLKKNTITDSMDLFSMGCVIAELYADGEPTFTLSQLFKFIKEDYKPDFSGFQDKYIVEIIEKCLRINPDDRISARELLEEYKGKCFPEFFYTFLYEFMESLNNCENFVQNDDNLTISDLKINYIYDSFESISRELKFEYKFNDTKSSDEFSIPLKLNLPTMPHNYTIKPRMFKNDSSSEASLLILNAVIALSKTLKQVNSKIKACELILVLSERINDQCKLDRSLPYLCSFLDEFIEATTFHHSNNQGSTAHNISPKVVCFALYSITSLLSTCSYITPINASLFPEYLLPKIYNLLIAKIDKDSQRMINCAIATCLPHLANVSKKFLIMSKSFKNQPSKDISIYQSYYPNNTNNNLISDEILKSYTSTTITKDQLDLKFKDITLVLLTDKDSSVRISLLQNILPLCQFFGVEKTNDIILPHLISYLNDSDPGLRMAFLSSVLKMGPFIGALSFEQYILPLLIQSLGDGEQLVVLKVLEIFNTFVADRLINPRTEFNALEIYKELLVNSINLILHPNEWIRQSVLLLIININQNLTDADRYCFLYPLIKGFLSYDISIIDWGNLYPCLTKPLSKPIYDLTITWCLNATGKSLFWQSKKSTNYVVNELAGSSSKKRLVSFSKNMGKSVYLPRLNTEVSFSNNSDKKTSKSTVPLSPEDKQWLIKLKSLGLDDRSLWKVFIMRDYIYHISKSTTTQTSQKSAQETKNQFENGISVRPRNIFFDIIYKSEPIVQPSVGIKNETVLPALEKDSVSITNKTRRGSGSLVLPTIGRVTASVQTVEANVFGEMDVHPSTSNNNNTNTKSRGKDSRGKEYRGDLHTRHGVFSVNNSKIVTTHIKHTYKGQNPYILKYLNGLNLYPNLSDFTEFGNIIYPKPTPKEIFKPKATLVAHVRCNDQSDEIDGITCLEICPTSEFFITGSELGILKIWDSYKMEKVITVKSSSLTMDLKSKITNIVFLPNRFVIVVSTIDGNIRVLRIDVMRNKTKRISRYMKLQLIRDYNLNDGSYVMSSQVVINDRDNLLICVDSQSRIQSFNLVTMERLEQLQNPLRYGIVNSFIMDTKNNTWLLIGTDRGILCLWDLRFKLLIKSWKVIVEINDTKSEVSSIKSLQILPSKLWNSSETTNKETSGLSFAMMCGGECSSSVSIWEIPSFECKAILRSDVTRSYYEKYQLIEIPSTHKRTPSSSSPIEDLKREIEILLDGPTPFDKKCLTSIKSIITNQPSLLSSTSDNRITLWNLNSITDSSSIDTTQISKFNKRTIGNQIMIDEVLEPKPESSLHAFKQHSSSFQEIMREGDMLGGGVTKSHQDVITGLGLLYEPFEMIVSVDRNGLINLYK